MRRVGAGRRGTGHAGAAAKQTGIALILALVVLAMMSLAAAALMRAVDTTTAVTGNLAFRAASIPPASAAIEAAVAALADASVIADRERDLPAQNYYASRQPGEDARGVPWLLQLPGRYPAAARTLDAGEGNAARYVIERVCLQPGPASAANCALAGNPPAAGNGRAEPVERSPGWDAGSAGSAHPAAAVPFFRITVRVDGPQNTVSHVQAMVRGSAPPGRMSWRILTE
jgi:type IV pilus assembly protein PilX